MKLIRVLVAAIAFIGMTNSAWAACETVCACNEDGACVCFNTCDVVINLDFRLGGSFGDGSLKLTGFPPAMNGQTLSIPNGTTLEAPRNAKPIEELLGARVAPGKYTVADGAVSLRIDK